MVNGTAQPVRGNGGGCDSRSGQKGFDGTGGRKFLTERDERERNLCRGQGIARGISVNRGMHGSQAVG